MYDSEDSEVTDNGRITLIWQIMGKIEREQGTGIVLFSRNDLQSAVDGWFDARQGPVPLERENWGGGDDEVCGDCDKDRLP